MKASEFRKLIREEVRKELNEANGELYDDSGEILANQLLDKLERDSNFLSELDDAQREIIIAALETLLVTI